MKSSLNKWFKYIAKKNSLLFALFSLIMEYDGTCGVCFRNLDKTHPGSSCCKCNKSFHMRCVKIDSPEQVPAPYICQPCAERRSILRLIEKQQTEMTKLSQSISNQINLSIKKLEDNSIKPLQDKVVTINNDVNTVRREQCECKVLITGIPESVSAPKDLRQVMIDIGKHFSLEISPFDINNCYWIKSRNKPKKVIVKFTNLFITNDLLKCYFREKNLEACDIISLGTDIKSRIYIEQLLPPAIERLSLYCRKLKKMGTISQFYVDFKTGVTKVTTMDGSVEHFEDLKKLSTKFMISS